MAFETHKNGRNKCPKSLVFGRLTKMKRTDNNFHFWTNRKQICFVTAKKVRAGEVAVERKAKGVSKEKDSLWKKKVSKRLVKQQASKTFTFTTSGIRRQRGWLKTETTS